MQTITIQISDADAARISFRAISAQSWIEQAAAGCAALAQQEIEASPEWSASVAAHLVAGGDVSDKDAIVVAGFSAGTLKSAAARQEEQERENAAKQQAMEADLEAKIDADAQAEQDAEAEFQARVAAAVAAELQRRSGQAE